MVKIGRLIPIFIFMLSSLVWADSGSISVQATVDRNVMRPGDTFTLSISVESEGSVQVDSPLLPDLTGFNIINRWSGSEIQSVFENGKFMTKRRLKYNFQIQAAQEGVFSIGAARVMASGQEFLTKPIRIEVTGSAPQVQQQQQQQDDDQQGAPPADEDDIFDQLLRDRLDRFMGRGRGRDSDVRQREIPNLDASDAFFIEVEVDKQKVYVGEQVTASYYLVTRGQVSDIDTLQYPTLAGFWKEDLELATRLNFKPEVINGIAYNRALLASYALFPIKAGTSVVDTYKAKCTIVSFNPFGMPGQKALVRESKPIKIEVMPLPTAGKPDDFVGAVGDFTMRAQLDKSETKTGEPVAYRIRFEGYGNAKLIELPKISFPNGLEVYSSKNDSKFNKNSQSYKEFEYLLVPRQVGEFIIPQISVSLFNATKKSYYTLKAEPRSIKVTQGAEDSTMGSKPLELAQREAPKGPSWPNPIFDMDPPLRGWLKYRAFVWPGLYGIASLGFLAWVTLALGWAKPRDTLRRKTRARLDEIRIMAKKGDYRFMGAQMAQLAAHVLGQISDFGGGGIDLNALLTKAPPSFRTDHGEKLKKLMNDCESLAYAPELLIAELKQPKRMHQMLSEFEVILMRALEIDFDQSRSEPK